MKHLKTQKQIRIANRTIGDNAPCFIIAEAGVNHNGKLNLAKKLVDAAASAGADAVKFQTYTAEEVVTDDAPTVAHQKGDSHKRQTQHDLLQKLSLGLNEFKELKAYCEKKRILFLTTAHSPDVLDAVNDLVPVHKIGSGDLTNLPFLKKVAALKKPIILSTGMGTILEIREAVQTIKSTGNKSIILTHCTTSYPCPLEEVNLRAMATLQKTFHLPVGYSDHTLGILIAPLAVALGAVVIEKHFTLDKTMNGPDHAASLDPKELKNFVQAIRDTERALGSSIKKPTTSEKKIMRFVRKSIVARFDIKKGARITADMLAIKRPEGGIAPKNFPLLIGKYAKQDIQKDTPIRRQFLTS